MSKSSTGPAAIEENFGRPLGSVKLNKGSIAIFGDTVDEGKLPGSAKTVSVNQKAGYPGRE